MTYVRKPQHSCNAMSAGKDYYAYPGSLRLPRSARINCAECIKGHESNRFCYIHGIRLLHRPMLSDLTIVLWKGDDKKKRPQKRRFLTV
jgi:hypothetical protein